MGFGEALPIPAVKKSFYIQTYAGRPSLGYLSHKLYYYALGQAPPP